MNEKTKDHQLFAAERYMYGFDYSWTNFRRVRLYDKRELDAMETNGLVLGELEGLIFSEQKIIPSEFPITEFSKTLEMYGAKVLYFENTK